MKAKKLEELKLELALAQRHVYELKAQLASTLGAAFDAAPKAEKYYGSAVILSVTALGGKEIIPPVAIRDGLSAATVKALQADLARSFELATLVNPAMAKSLPEISRP